MVIDLSATRLWDITAVAALDTVVARLRQHQVQVRVLGLDAGSRGLVRRLRREQLLGGGPD